MSTEQINLFRSLDRQSRGQMLKELPGRQRNRFLGDLDQTGRWAAVNAVDPWMNSGDLEKECSKDDPNIKLKPLRPHQEKGIGLLRQAFKEGRKWVLFKAPTGYGKGVVAAHIIDSALKKNSRVMYVVNAITLLDQAVERFSNEGIDHIGVMQGDHPLTDPTAPVQVCTVQTLTRRQIPECELIIIDECDNQYSLYHKWKTDEIWKRVLFVGFTATPYAKGLGRTWDELIISSTTRELIESGYLCPYKVAASDHPDLTGAKITHKNGEADYTEESAEKMMKPIYGNAVETWLKLAYDRPTLLYTAKQSSAKYVQELFLKQGINWGYIDAFTTLDERKKQFKDLENGTIKGISNILTLTTGVDLPFVSCIQFMRPTRSKRIYQQIFGRGLRTSVNKKNLLFIDHTDTVLKGLGDLCDMEDALSLEGLDDGKKKKSKNKKKTPLPKECPQCSFLKPAKQIKCSQCGFETKKVEGLDEIDSEIVLIDGVKREFDPDKKTFMSQLMMYATEKPGIKNKYGWASHKYREVFGVWPRGGIEAVRVEPETRAWLLKKFRQYMAIKSKKQAA